MNKDKIIEIADKVHHKWITNPTDTFENMLESELSAPESETDEQPKHPTSWRDFTMTEQGQQTAENVKTIKEIFPNILTSEAEKDVSDEDIEKWAVTNFTYGIVGEWDWLRLARIEGAKAMRDNKIKHTKK